MYNWFNSFLTLASGGDKEISGIVTSFFMTNGIIMRRGAGHFPHTCAQTPLPTKLEIYVIADTDRSVYLLFVSVATRGQWYVHCAEIHGQCQTRCRSNRRAVGKLRRQLRCVSRYLHVCHYTTEPLPPLAFRVRFFGQWKTYLCPEVFDPLYWCLGISDSFAGSSSD